MKYLVQHTKQHYSYGKPNYNFFIRDQRIRDMWTFLNTEIMRLK